MIKHFTILVLFIALFSCEKVLENDLSLEDYTGNELVYNLYSASEFNITGFASFKEKSDKSIVVEIKLSNTSGRIFHPVHIHEGAIQENGRLVMVLNPVLGETGRSKTTFKSLMTNESVPFTYEDLTKFNGSLRIHLDGGPGQDIILSAANIGRNPNISTNSIAVCKDW